MTTLNISHEIILSALKNISHDTSLPDIEFAWAQAEAMLLPMLSTVSGDMEKCAQELVRRATGFAPAFPDSHNRLRKSGLNGNPIFFGSIDNDMTVVIKAFPVGNYSFVKELWAMSNLYTITAQVPRFISMGKCESNFTTYVLIATEYVDGTLLDEMIFSMAKMPLGQERDVLLQKLLPIFYQLGALLGKLHTSGPTFYGTWTRYLIDIHERMLTKALHGLAHEETGLNLTSVEVFAQKAMSNLHHHEYRYAYVHGDSHPGNYIYDAKRDHIVMLDLEDGAYSVGGYEKPLGSPFLDYIRINASIQVRQQFGLLYREFLCIKEALDRGYQENGATLPEKSIEDFYRFMEVLSYFEWFFAHEKNLTKDAQMTMRTIFMQGIVWIKALVGEK